MEERVIVLSTISPVTNIINQSEKSIGILGLVLRPPYYSICFRKISNLDENILSTELPKFLSENEDTQRLLCHTIKYFIVSEDENDIIFTIQDFDSYQFIIPKENISSCCYFLQQLLINGIAAPRYENGNCLNFYENCYYHSTIAVPSHIQLYHPFFTTFDEFWNDVINFYREFIVFSFKSKTLPHDHKHTLGFAANSLLTYKMNIINQYIANLPSYDIITSAEFDSLFDSNGVLKDPELFKKRLFYCACEDELLPKIIPFAVEVYPLDSTFEEREKIDNDMKFEFKRLYDQVSSISKKQIKRHKKLRESFRVINQDADRTDRLSNTFKNPKKPGLFMLTTLLKCYCLYNQRIGYLQGMNDMFVPLITTFIHEWTIDGDPIDEEKQIISVEKILSDYSPIIFFCYASIIKRTGHTKLLSNVTAQSNKISHTMISIVSKFEPLIGIWLAQNSLSEFLWMYSDFIYIYKRSFKMIWNLWLQMNCFPSPQEWILYFASAILLEMFKDISVFSDLSMPFMMDTYPKILASLDVRRVGNIALYLYENCRLTDEDYKLTVGQIYGIVENFNGKEEILNNETYHFDFFEFNE